ncbi:nuclear pore complex protein like protein [Tanacetum coccineum]
MLLHSPPRLLLPHSTFLPNTHFLKTPTRHFPTSRLFPRLLAQLPDSGGPVDGPVELPFSMPSFIATDDDPSTIQVATSVLLTGAVSIFLFRSLRRRAKRAKQLQFRSTGAKKTLKEEALESLKAMTPVDRNAPPSALQALLGGLSAGVIALILYKFTTTIEASLNRQTISDNFSIELTTIN